MRVVSDDLKRKVEKGMSSEGSSDYMGAEDPLFLMES